MQPAGYLTQHDGEGYCLWHTTSDDIVTSVLQTQSPKEVRQLVNTGRPFVTIEDTPVVELILREIGRSAGMITWISDKLSRMDETDMVYTDDDGVQHESPWVAIHERERQRLMSWLNQAVQRGLDEKRIRLAEAQGQQLLAVILEFARQLGRDPDAIDVREAIQRAMITQGVVQSDAVELETEEEP